MDSRDLQELQDLLKEIRILREEFDLLVKKNREVKLQAIKKHGKLEKRIQTAEYYTGVYHQEIGRRRREGFKGVLIEKLEKLTGLFPKGRLH
jgi:hypothetical protein